MDPISLGVEVLQGDGVQVVVVGGDIVIYPDQVGLFRSWEVGGEVNNGDVDVGIGEDRACPLV